MTLEQKVNEDMKAAMKAGEKEKLIALRSLRAAILEFQKSGTGDKLDEAAEMKILKTAVKKRRDAIELYEKGGREDLLAQEKLELAVIEIYMPQMMNEDQIKAKIQDIVSAVGAKSMADMGKVMGMAMKEFKGKADGGEVNRITKEILESL